MIAFDVLLGEATNIEKSVSGSLDVEYAISDSDIRSISDSNIPAISHGSIHKNLDNLDIQNR